jgi:hypothetical protein
MFDMLKVNAQMIEEIVRGLQREIELLKLLPPCQSSFHSFSARDLGQFVLSKFNVIIGMLSQVYGIMIFVHRACMRVLLLKAVLTKEIVFAVLALQIRELLITT